MQGLLTTRQVAVRKGVSVWTVRRWVEAGRLEPEGKVPFTTGSYLFDPATVDAFDPTEQTDGAA